MTRPGSGKIDRLADQLLDWWGHVPNLNSFSSLLTPPWRAPIVDAAPRLPG